MPEINEQTPCIYCGAIDANTHANTCRNNGQSEQPPLNPISEESE